ncbi:MAG: DMT family transporter [Clostridia bacterium]|nr:DMT family transporter [Clostridia bacterium]
MKTKTVGILSALALVLTTIIWGFSFVAQVFGAFSIPPFQFTGIRFILGAIAITPVVAILEHDKSCGGRTKDTLIGGAVTGLILFAASNLQQFGVQWTSSSSKSGFLTGIYTVLVPIFAWLLLKRKVKINIWISLVIVLIGMYLLCFEPGEGFEFGKGELMLLIGAFVWAFHVLSVDHFSHRVNMLHFALVQFLTCGLLSLICALIFEDFSLAAIIDAKWSILYLSIFSVAAGYTLQVIGQKNVDVSIAAIIFALESVFSLIGGIIFGIDHLTVFNGIGSLLIFSGLVLSQIDFSKKKDESENST